MTQKEKARRYDEAIHNAKRIIDVCVDDNTECRSMIACIQQIFPELQKSEDDEIMKELLLYFNSQDIAHQYVDDNRRKRWTTWLEKQETSYTKKDIDDVYLKGVTDTKKELEKQYEETYQIRKDIATFIFNYRGDIKDRAKWMDYLGIKVSFVEKQGEQKSADKVEPKFHEGNWVVNNNGEPQFYQVTLYSWPDSKIKGAKNNFETFINTATLDKQYHLWTIQDAKDGDVLCTYECCEPKIVFILKGTPKKHYALSYHCYYNIMYPHFESDSKKGCLGPNDEDVKPATKEQRDTLFAKMKEAGYEWDAEKKELKKIEEEEYNGEDYGIDSLYHAQRILEKTLGSVDGYQSDDGILEHKCAISAVKKLYEQKYAKQPYNYELEEEIEEWLGCEAFPEGTNITPLPKAMEIVRETANHFYDFGRKQQSIRNIQYTNSQVITPESYINEGQKKGIQIVLDNPQEYGLQKPAEWSEEDERQYRAAIAICNSLGHTNTADWLKSHRPQSHWKPSEEQMLAMQKALVDLCGKDEHNIITGLYYDLKKLRKE